MKIEIEVSKKKTIVSVMAGILFGVAIYHVSRTGHPLTVCILANVMGFDCTAVFLGK